MKKSCCFMFLSYFLIATGLCYSQPYLDVAKVYYSHCPEKVLNEKKNPLHSDNYNISLTLPIELKKDGDAFLLNPFFDNYWGKIAGRSFHVISQALGAGFLKKFNNKEWNFLSVFFLRRNKVEGKKVDDLLQYGGAIITTWNKSPSLVLKLGLYYNHEFYRNLFIPLAGIDWKIDERNDLFGVIPNNLIYQHKVSRRFYYGASFRATTNAYRLQTIDPCAKGDCSGRNYLRINDNQLGLFADTYITPKIVFTAETGYTILRKYNFGFKGNVLHNSTDYKNDNFYIKASLAYRMRFR